MGDHLQKLLRAVHGPLRSPCGGREQALLRAPQTPRPWPDFSQKPVSCCRFSSNSIGDEGAKALAESLQENRSLESLE